MTARRGRGILEVVLGRHDGGRTVGKVPVAGKARARGEEAIEHGDAPVEAAELGFVAFRLTEVDRDELGRYLAAEVGVGRLRERWQGRDERGGVYADNVDAFERVSRPFDLKEAGDLNLDWRRSCIRDASASSGASLSCPSRFGAIKRLTDVDEVASRGRVEGERELVPGSATADDSLLAERVDEGGLIDEDVANHLGGLARVQVVLVELDIEGAQVFLHLPTDLDRSLLATTLALRDQAVGERRRGSAAGTNQLTIHRGRVCKTRPTRR